MTHFDRAAQLFDDLLELPEGDRVGALARLSEDDEVMRLLGTMIAGEQGAGPDLEPAAAAPAGLPEMVGPYRILGLLGEGGMGRVYEAEQAEPKRRVALKVLRGAFASEATRTRFANEAQALAWLSHPGIATVYEAGTVLVNGEAWPYLAMERIEGERLDAWLVNHAPTLSSRVELIARICDAVHNAHQKGVVHRDLKPANVLVDAEGRPKVLDFGIARFVDSEVTQQVTGTGQLLGTLPYMSPEQLSGNSARIDLRSDVWSLGVLLYEALSGRRPHDLAELSIAEATHRITHDDAPALGGLDERFRGDLETIAAKALTPEPERRYGSASELAADLRRFLEHEPILARPATTLYQVRKFVRRNRWLVAGASSTVMALVIGLVGTSIFALRASERSQAEIVAREAAESAEAEARRSEAEARASQREAERQATNAAAVRNVFLATLREAMPARAQGKEVTVVEALARVDEDLEREGLQDPEFLHHVRVTQATVHSSLREHETALAYAREAAELAEVFTTRESDEYRRAAKWVAGSLMQLERGEEAAEVFREVVRLSGIDDPTQAPGPDQLCLKSQGHLATLAFRAGQFQQAIELSTQAIEGFRRLGPDYRAALACELYQMSSNLMYTGDREGELQHAEEAFEILREVGLEKFSDPIGMTLQYANALDDAGMPEEAVALYREGLEHLSDWYGADGRQTHMMRYNMALALGSMGEVDEAVELLDGAHAAMRSLYGPDHRDTVLIVHGMLTTLGAAGRHEEALLWMDEHAPDPPDLYQGWLVLLARGRLLCLVEAWDEAADTLRVAFEKISTRVPVGNPHLNDCLAALVMASEALGRTTDAARYTDLLAKNRAAAPTAGE